MPRLIAVGLWLGLGVGSCAPDYELGDPPPGSCSDGERNGQETDVDCGGPDCAPCPAGGACLLPRDCSSDACVGEQCQTSGPVGTGGTGSGGAGEPGDRAGAGQAGFDSTGGAGGQGAEGGATLGGAGGSGGGSTPSPGGSAGTVAGAGGNATGGVLVGDGGASGTGGEATGGVATGGAPTGGVPTGGVPTGGVPTGGVPTGGVPTGGVPEPPDCSAISNHAGWELCETGPGSCAAVFADGAGCDAVCAEVGLTCSQVWDNLDGECAKMPDRPELTCSPATGHDSDYCVCSG